MSTARRPVASLKQLLDTWRAAGAGATTGGDVVTIGQYAHVTRVDVGTNVVMGGAPNRENVVGGNTANVNTANSNLTDAPTLTNENGNWNVVGGGYDTVVNGWACVVSGMHQKVEAGASHGTIGGGSTHAIAADVDYATIGGGAVNQANADYVTIAGGSLNNASGERATIGGGGSNAASGASSSILGGTSNTASGINSSVIGGTTNQATGASSTVAGGASNTATGNYAVVAGGTLNDATASNATIAGGTSSDASQVGATVGGGSTNVASGYYATVPGGYINTASGSYSTAIGREAVAARYGQQAHAAGKFAAAGDAQTAIVVARRQTTDATPAVLGCDGTVNTPISIATNTTAAFSAIVTGRRVNAGGEASAGYKCEGLIKNDGGTVSFVGTPTLTVLGEDDAAWDCAFTANNTNKSLTITVTGAAGVTVNWVARVTLVETVG